METGPQIKVNSLSCFVSSQVNKLQSELLVQQRYIELPEAE